MCVGRKCCRSIYDSRRALISIFNAGFLLLSKLISNVQICCNMKTSQAASLLDMYATLNDKFESLVVDLK